MADRRPEGWTSLTLPRAGAGVDFAHDRRRPKLARFSVGVRSWKGGLRSRSRNTPAEPSEGAPTVRAMSKALVRQRSLVPMASGSLEGWMDEDAAAAAGQLFGSGPGGVLVIDARELLTSTARVVGAELGPLHFKVWMGLVTLHVAHGMPEDGRSATTIGELNRLIYGSGGGGGGKTTYQLLQVLFELRDAKLTVPGYDMVSQQPADGVSDTGLLINLYVDKTILRTYSVNKVKEEARRDARKKGMSKAQLEHRLTEIEQEHDYVKDREQFGRLLGKQPRGTLAWRLHPDYAQRLAETDLRRFDWTKAQALRGVAVALWMVFSSERIPYRPVLESPEDLEVVEIPLTDEHCHALGVHAATDAARRRTLNDAGRRVCDADRSFVEFQAHGGRGRQSFLRVIRNTRPSALERQPPPATQLTLDAAA